jgi:hypothetical protein
MDDEVGVLVAEAVDERRSVAHVRLGTPALSRMVDVAEQAVHYIPLIAAAAAAVLSSGTRRWPAASPRQPWPQSSRIDPLRL